MPHVAVPPSSLPGLAALADASSSRYKTEDGHYRNDFVTHLIGKIGECAAERYFRGWQLPVRAHWRDPEQEKLCDLTVGHVRVEIKCFSSQSWAEFGGSVAMNQVPRLRAKADVVAWARLVEGHPNGERSWRLAVEATRSPTWVWLAGWASLNDVVRRPATRMEHRDGRVIVNHQVPEAEMAPMIDLVDVVARELGITPVHAFDALRQEA